MDRVTNSLVNDFLENYEIKSSDISEDFEKFSSYCVFSHEYSETFETDDVIVGESPGIDGIGIIVNGRLINSKEEADDLKEINKYIEAKFIFIQSKTSDNFDGGEIGSFGHAILDIFSKKQQVSHNETVIRKLEIINHIYDKYSPAMTKGLPICKFYFVTTGKWTNDKNLRSRFNSIRNDLINTKYFSDVVGIPLGAQEVQKFYMATKMAISAEVNFQYRVVIPKEMEGVEESYIGILPFSEFGKLIIDENENIKPVFYDNVRAFQGENPVNLSIQETVQSNKVERFSVLNNGITIVTKGLTIVGNKATIQDYQIVNGCQTSHVIYNNKNIKNLDNSLWIPVKIIVTRDENVVNDIITATNNQTEVKPEQLAALSQFQKDLEMYYESYKGGDGELYYERRSKQYANQSGISKTKIITIPTQIKAFAAIFLGLPHKVSRYYGTIVKDIGGDIFSPDHLHISYYTSALAYYKLDVLFRTGEIDPKYKKCRFHLLFVFSSIVAGPDTPKLNSKKMNKYCRKIIDALNGSRCRYWFSKATTVIDKSKIDINNRDNFKKQTVTEKLRNLIPIRKMKK